MAEMVLSESKIEKGKAPQTKTESSKKETVGLCLDVSGSMQEFMPTTGVKKIQCLKDAASYLISQSSPARCSYIAISFHSVVVPIGPPAKVYSSPGDFNLLKGYLYQLKPVGGTIFSSPLLALIPRVTRIILVSDGMPIDSIDVGTRCLPELKGRGIKVDTVAIPTANEEFMEWLAKETGGIYRFVNTPEQLTQILGMLETKNRLLLENKNV